VTGQGQKERKIKIKEYKIETTGENHSKQN
jgi:hypothetical protein